ncbi:MAG: Csu type fimbrial protein [Spirochaetota bacterium]
MMKWRMLKYVSISLFGFLIFPNILSSDTTKLMTIALVRQMVKISAKQMYFKSLDDVGTYYATSTITVKAPIGMCFNITIDAGQNYSGDSRCMKRINKPELIPYQVFKDPGYSQQWGDSDFDNTFPYGTSLYGFTKSPITYFTAYGRVILQEVPVPGIYIDMLTVTIYY